MKIAMVCYPTHGGSGVVATELGLGLAKMGHEVHFISYSSPFRLRGFQQNVYYHEVNVSAYPLFKYPPYDLSLATKILEITREYNLDIVHVHYAIPHAISAYLAKQMLKGQGPKTVTTLHGTDITLVGQDKTFYEVVQFSIEESDGVTTVSNYLTERTKRDFAIKKDIKTIYNFVDTNRFSGVVTNCDARLFKPNNEKLLIHTSNFRKVKRLPDIIRIFAAVKKHVPSRLLLVGEGPERQTAHDLAVELGVHDDVLFLGTQDYIENLLGCADVFLLPSSEESFGLAALEAMSCETPVVGSTVGGIPEVVDHNLNGFLHPVGDVEAMSNSIVELLTNDGMIRDFKHEARKKAVTVFESSLLVPEYEKYYLKILNS
ncbi:MAG TPA: N-acetyl-alpha-D-glucosaminyl L-malate synthase BshA [bacterium]|nr:N-acetyl-alpha-D-glucosaminyl L-malate synthase BshA [bacterium]HPN42803.1 N-acetyl-alpha-D-glucosaminyl L-malate synthase BshA [bacterium]